MSRKMGTPFHHRKGTRAQTFVEFVDLAPTVLSLAGISPPKGIDGTAVSGEFSDVSEVKKRIQLLDTLTDLMRNMIW